MPSSRDRSAATLRPTFVPPRARFVVIDGDQELTPAEQEHALRALVFSSEQWPAVEIES